MADAVRQAITAEWKHGSWHLATGGLDVGGIRSVADLRGALERTARGGDEVEFVLPRSVQRLIDEAAALEAAGLYAAAETCRGGAARLLRSKRMRDDDIAHCLDVPLPVVLAYLPAAR